MGHAPDAEDDERRLRIELLHAEVENKRAYKRRLLRKTVIAAFAAGGIIFGALGYKLGSTPPAPLYIQLLPSDVRF
jgi:hypothetical protein